jgi:hypothetical protein
MPDSAEINSLRNVVFGLLLERERLMASIEKLNQVIEQHKESIAQLEADTRTLITAHSSCPTTQQLEAASASVAEAGAKVQSLSAQIKAAVAQT